MTKKPIIGITADYSTKDHYSKYPWYALRENYAGCLTDLGAIPLILPHDLNAIPVYEALIDGLVITGGDFDIDPRYYGEDINPEVTNIIEGRTSFEMAIFKQFYASGKPIFGICGGQQLINVALGGSLVQHIPDITNNVIPHSQPNPRHQTSHTVNIEPTSKLHTICQQSKIEVNSSHHQAVARLGKNLIASGIAPDGVIEAIEDATHPFCMGMQWHPEFFCTEHDRAIIQSFVTACKK